MNCGVERRKIIWKKYFVILIVLSTIGEGIFWQFPNKAVSDGSRASVSRNRQTPKAQCEVTGRLNKQSRTTLNKELKSVYHSYNGKVRKARRKMGEDRFELAL